MKWLSYIGWFGLNRLLVVAPDTNGGGYHLGICHKRKNALSVSEMTFCEAEALPKKLDAFGDLPIVLRVDSEEIITGKIREGEDPLFAVLGVKVDAPKAFWVQKLPQADGSVHVAVARRDALAEWAKPFAQVAERVVFWSLSDVGMQYVAGAEEMPDAEAKLLGTAIHAHLDLAEGAYAKRAADFHANHLWVRRLMITLIVLLGLLCLGFVADKALGHQIQVEKARLSESAPDRQKLDSLESAIAEVEEVLATYEAFDLNPSRHAYWLDQIARSCPPSVHLQGLYLFPNEQRLKKLDRTLLDDPPAMAISGRTTAAEDVALLLQNLQSRPFFSRIETLKSEYNHPKQAYEFVLLGWMGIIDGVMD